MRQSLLFHVFLVILVSAGLLLLFFGSLNWLTNHGQELKVPELMGKSMAAAVDKLEDLGFRIQIDSTYQANHKPLEILFQEPEAGTSVKVGRTIFLTVNRKNPPSIEMPNLVNMSFRNALLTLHSYQLEIGDTSYRPDVAAGAVLEQHLDGKPILPGTRIPFGTKIDLVIGEGLSGETDVPNLIGLTWAAAQSLLDSMLLTANPVWEGKITDSAHAIVYRQDPEAINELDVRNSIPEGDIIDLYLMQNPSQELLDANQPGSKKLLGEEFADSNAEVLEVPSRHTPRSTTDTQSKRKLIPGMNIKSDKKEDKKDSKDKTASGVKSSKSNTTKKDSDVKPAKTPKPKAVSNDDQPAHDYE